jgi:sec-independent protein translocase protein TatA
MGALSPTHLILILLIALIVIGPGKLPEVGAAMGKSIKEFKKASGDIMENITGTAPPAQSAPQAQQAAYQPVQPAAYQAPYQPPAGAVVPQPGQPAYPAPMPNYPPQPDAAPGYASQPGQPANPAPMPYYPPQPMPVAPAPDAYQPASGVVVEPPSGPTAG